MRLSLPDNNPPSHINASQSTCQIKSTSFCVSTPPSNPLPLLPCFSLSLWHQPEKHISHHQHNEAQTTLDSRHQCRVLTVEWNLLSTCSEVWQGSWLITMCRRYLVSFITLTPCQVLPLVWLLSLPTRGLLGGEKRCRIGCRCFGVELGLILSLVSCNYFY